MLAVAVRCSADNLLETSIKENISARGSAIIQGFAADRTFVSTAGTGTLANLSFTLAEKGKYSVHTGNCQTLPPLVQMTGTEAGSITTTISPGQLQTGLNQLSLCYWEPVRGLLSDSIAFDLTRDDTAPILASTTPTNNAYHVDTDTNVSITFSERIILPTDTNTAIQVTNNQGAVTGTVGLNNETNTLTFQPATNFGFTKNIRVDLLAGITDLAGNALTPVTIRFATRFTIQDGTLGVDQLFDLALDASDNIYAVGAVEASLDGQPYQPGGAKDAFLIKYDVNGQKVFTRMIGSSGTSGTSNDIFRAVVVDSSGTIFIAGNSFGSSSITFDGIAKIGGWDGFLIRYGSNGSKLSTDLFGSTSTDSPNVLLSDNAGNFYLAGEARTAATLIDGQAFIGSDDILHRKYNSSGVRIYTRITGTTLSENVYAGAMDSSGSLYITGQTPGSIAGTNPDGLSDMYLMKFDTNGNELWRRQVNNTGKEEAFALLIDGSGNIWQCGYATQAYDGNGTFGLSDLIVTKYNSSGTKLFSRQYGTAHNDYCRGIAKDSSGNIFLAGTTEGNLASANADITNTSQDLFLMKMDTNGNILWSKQYGGPATELMTAIKINSRYEIFIGGYTTSNLEGNTLLSASKADFFIMKFDTNGNLY